MKARAEQHRHVPQRHAFLAQPPGLRADAFNLDRTLDGYQGIYERLAKGR